MCFSHFLREFIEYYYRNNITADEGEELPFEIKVFGNSEQTKDKLFCGDEAIRNILASKI